MAKSDSKDSKSTTSAAVEETVYVTEEAPDLPTANVSVSREAPVIDQRLIDARNAEAKATADRFNK
jgi:hypothetical protein